MKIIDLPWMTLKLTYNQYSRLS